MSVGRFAACMQFASCGQLWFLRAAGMPAVMVWEKFLYAEERIGDFSDTFRVKIWLEEIMDKRDEELSGFEVRQGGAAYAVGVFIIAFSAMLLILEIKYHIKAIPAWIYFVIVCMFLLGGYVWAEARNRRLVQAGGTFYYRNIWGKTKVFSLEDIGYGKAAYHASKGRDYLRLYGKEGKLLCRLECSMKNAEYLIWYLHENEVRLELEKGAEGFAGEIIGQRRVAREEMAGLSREIYGKVQALAGKWQARNERMGAELEYGYACYYREKMKDGRQLQPEGSRFSFPGIREGREEGLPEDFYCRLEFYVKKEGETVRERNGRLPMLAVPVFYRRKSMAEGGGNRLYFHSGWQEELEGELAWLETYLPKHKFVLAEKNPGECLIKDLLCNAEEIRIAE